MTARLMPFWDDPIEPSLPAALSITIDGIATAGVQGQTLAGVILASGSLAWRRTSVRDKPRGLFCGIGVCFDCLVEVDGLPDVRACQRRATDGDVVVTVSPAGPAPVARWVETRDPEATHD